MHGVWVGIRPGVLNAPSTCIPPFRPPTARAQDNAEYVRKALDIPALRVLAVEDEGVVTGDVSGRAKDVVPLEPAVHPSVAPL